MEDNSFGTWLRRRRRALDLTQGALADCAGCSIVTIRKFEADERRPSRLLAERLADCLQVPAAERERLVAFARQPELVAPGARSPAPVVPVLTVPHGAS